MADSIDLRSITKFDGSNFQAWKFQMKAIFIANGLTSIVDGTTLRPAENTSEWDRRNAKAMVIISSTIEASQFEYLLTCEKAAEMWNRLTAIYEQKTESNKLLLMTRFHDYKMASNDNVAQHIAKIENMARQLKDVGESVSDITIMAKVLGSLPGKFSAFTTAWDSVDTNSQTLENLTQRLIKEESRMNTVDEACGALAINMKHNKEKQNDRRASEKTHNLRKEITCFYCQKRGHIAKDCRKKKREESNRDKDKEKDRKRSGASDISAFTVEVHENEIMNAATKDVWLLDSGASRHMTFRHDWLSELQSSSNEHVSLGDGTSCKVMGHGTVYIKRFVDGVWLEGKLQNVLYVPNLNKNLFSIGACMDKAYKVTFKGDYVEFFMGNELKAQGMKQNNNLFRMFIKVQIRNDANLVATSSLKRWHERLGHVNYKYIHQLCKEGLIDGAIKGSNSDEDIFCEACQYGKQHRLSFNHTVKRNPLPGEFIHSDVCGPMSQDSLGGSKFFVSFKDDCSAFRIVYFIRHKYDVIEKFKEFVNLLENKFQRRIKTLRVDNGREYCNEQMSRYLRIKGINLETTAPFTPEQNGRAERDNRSLIESARAMLHAKNLPVRLWAEAVNTACYILNRTPTSCNQGKTPYEIWNGRKPRLDHIKVFGSEAYVHIPKLRKKWDKKSRKMILVGYQAESCNYRLYNPQTSQITVSRDVIIHETNHQQVMKLDDETEISIDARTLDQERNVEDVTEDIKNASLEDEGIEKDNLQINTRTLRDRSTLKPPKRYEANTVEFEEPTSYEEAITRKDAEKWRRAIDEELRAHEINNTWIFQDLPAGKKAIESKWVFKVKRATSDDNSCYKARLCAKGFTQKHGIDYHEIFSPVARYDSIRTMLAIAAKEDLEIAQFDVKTAFLNGNLSEEIYMKVPHGVKPPSDGKVCRL